jgi:hypothetical protein
MNITDELGRLREQDKDFALILDTFREIDRIHRQALKAMGRTSEAVSDVRSSAEVRLFAETAVSTTNRRIGP